MKVAAAPDVHLTYCTNIYPGERWSEVRAALVEHVVAVKKRVARDRPFGVGLRLSARAAEELDQPAAREDLRSVLADNDLYVFTLNGFPFGSFHKTRVKEAVYRPDWLERERATYSETLARLLADLLPEGVDGSVSTVPVAFAPRVRGASDDERAGDALVDHAAFLHGLHESTGRSIGLALEPEPACRLETTTDAAAFFERTLFCPEQITRYATRTGLSGSAAEESLRRHLGVCLDTCHAAVGFEEVDQSIERLRAAGIRILKVQLSAGLRVRTVDRATLAALEPFTDDVYLHQVVVRDASGTRSFLDLPEALRAGRGPGDAEWRIHFHVPLFLATLDPFDSTRGVVEHTLVRQRERPISSHLEVETYTWDVLPAEHRRGDVDDAIARELDWVRARLGA